MSNELIQTVQLPVNPSLLQAIRARAEQHLADARSLVCTPDSLSAVKSRRAEVQKEYDSAEEWRKAIKRWSMEEYNRFEADFKAAIDDTAKALSIYSGEILETEESIKKDCEDGLREYFAELCAVHHLDWLTYERAGIKVDMASAKAKTPKKLREQLAAFVAGVAESIDRINALEDAGEIMVEYQRTLDAAGAICAVKDRHQRIDEQRKFQEALASIRAQEEEAVRRVEALAPPVVVKATEKDPNEVIPRLTFACINATRAQLRRVREFLNMEGIKYE